MHAILALGDGRVSLAGRDGEVEFVLETGEAHVYASVRATMEQARHFHKMLGVVLGEED